MSYVFDHPSKDGLRRAVAAATSIEQLREIRDYLDLRDSLLTRLDNMTEQGEFTKGFNKMEAVQ